MKYLLLIRTKSDTRLYVGMDYRLIGLRRGQVEPVIQVCDVLRNGRLRPLRRETWTEWGRGGALRACSEARPCSAGANPIYGEHAHRNRHQCAILALVSAISIEGVLARGLEGGEEEKRRFVPQQMLIHPNGLGDRI